MDVTTLRHRTAFPFASALRPQRRTHRPPRRRIAAVLGGLSMLAIAPTASAEPERHLLYFRPSPSPDAVGYVVHLGLESEQYTQHVDIGAPGQDDALLVYATDIDTSLDVYVALSSYNAAGISSAYSNETLVAATITDPNEPPPAPEPDPEPEPPTPPSPPTTDPGVGTTLSSFFAARALGLTANASGLISQVLGDGSTRPLTVDSLAADRNLRATRCDLEGDGDRDFVIGFGPGSDGRVALLYMEEGSVDRVESVVAGDAAYHAADGQTYPACGDVDGDGVNELVIGMGPDANAELMVFDGSDTDFAPYPIGNGGLIAAPTTRALVRQGTGCVPTLGDIDGDGLAELIVGYTAPRNLAVAFLDDALREFARHETLESDSPLVQVQRVADANGVLGGGTYPASGDFDGDGRDEIAVGFGQGGAGWMLFFDDALTVRPDSYESHLEIQTGRETIRDNSGAARPAFGDFDDDGREELIVGFGDGGSYEIQVFEDFDTGGLRIFRGGEGYVAGGSTNDRWIAAP